MLCDKRMPVGLKGEVYHMVVRPTVLYESECWPIKKDTGAKANGSRDEDD